MSCLRDTPYCEKFQRFSCPCVASVKYFDRSRYQLSVCVSGNMYSDMREEARDHARVRNAYFEQVRVLYLLGTFSRVCRRNLVSKLLLRELVQSSFNF